MLVYIRYFSKVFYAYGYTDGFLEKQNRKNTEQYLGWGGPMIVQIKMQRSEVRWYVYSSIPRGIPG